MPKLIRDALGLHEGDQVRFELDPVHGKTVMEPIRFRPEDLASFAIPGARRMSFAEMEAAKRAGALQCLLSGMTLNSPCACAPGPTIPCPSESASLPLSPENSPPLREIA